MMDANERAAEASTNGSMARRPTAGRTVVIVLAEVVVIVALLVLWSVLRGGKTSD